MWKAQEGGGGENSLRAAAVEALEDGRLDIIAERPNLRVVEHAFEKAEEAFDARRRGGDDGDLQENIVPGLHRLVVPQLVVGVEDLLVGGAVEALAVEALGNRRDLRLHGADLLGADEVEAREVSSPISQSSSSCFWLRF